MAQRARPSRGTTRKPVTIDLEAEKIDAEKSASADRQAEPVALDEPADQGAKGGDETDHAALDAGGDEAEPKPEADTAGPPPSDAGMAAPPTGRGGSGAVAGGLVGGLIALIGAAGLQWSGILPALAPQPEPAPVVDLSPVETRIGELETQIADLTASQAAPADAFAALTERIAAVEAGAEDAQTRADATRAALDDIGARVDQLNAAISAGEAGENAGLETLTGRLEDLEQQIAALSQSIGDAPGAAALAQLATDTAAALAASEAVQGALDGASGRIDTMEQAVSSLQSGVSDMLADVESRLTAAETAIAEGGTDSSIVARAIAAAGLKSAIDRGSAFMTELEAYASIAGEDETVMRLRDFAATGVPTVSQLSDQFASVANRIVATGQGLDPDASIADRLMSSARGLVQVRPVGEAVGDTPGAIAARMEARLRAGELDAALAQWELLPEAAKTASGAFAEQLRARQSVDALVAGALEAAMAAARPPGTTQ